MQLTSVTVRNFRCIRELTVELDPVTVLVGENNSGKTAFLEAIRIGLDRLRGRSRSLFHEYDYHLADESSTPSTADPIEIELLFQEPAPESWPNDVIQELDKIAVLGADDRYRVLLRLTSAFDAGAGDFVLDWCFLDAERNPLTGTARNASQLAVLQRLAPVFYLSALRDASEHFTARGRYWRAFLSESSMPEAERTALEREFSGLNERLLGAHPPLTDVRSRLEHAKRVIEFGAGDAVTIDALPTKLFALLSRTQVSLRSRVGAKIPVDRQGEGTQSLAVLLLFDAFLRSRLSQFDTLAEPITALEEPEAHLHPSAVRALMGVVGDLPGQKLISTHSGDLLAAVDPEAVRRFVHRDGRVQVHRIAPGTLSPEESRKFDFHVRRSRGELLFARCWLLGEGETEMTLFTGAADALGLDLERAGVRCVEYAQADVAMFAKVANQLGIPWYCVVDDDDGRKKYEKAIRSQLDGEDEADRLVIPYANIEVLLCEEGFGHLYETRMSVQKPQPTAAKGTLEYWKQVLDALPGRYPKPGVALEAALEMQADRTRVPKVLEEILIKAIALAKA